MRTRIRKSEQEIVSGTRFTIVISIIGITLSAISLMVFSFIVVLKSIWNAFAHEEYDVDTAKHLAVVFIELADLFLFAMVLQVVTIGMYQLFINPNVRVPDWMRVESLSDLKTQLVNVIVVLLAVTFLATAVSWTSDRSILYLGAAIGLVILSLAVYTFAHHQIEHEKKSSKSASHSVSDQ